MKFGASLRSTACSSKETQELHAAYKRLKKRLKRLPDRRTLAGESSLSSRSAQALLVSEETSFVAELCTDVACFNNMFLEREEDAVIQLWVLEKALDEELENNEESPDDLHHMHRQLVDFHGELLLLEHWSMLAHMALVKILKKYRKRTGLLPRALCVENLSSQPFASTEVTHELLRKVEARIDALCSNGFRTLSGADSVAHSVDSLQIGADMESETSDVEAAGNTASPTAKPAAAEPACTGVSCGPAAFMRGACMPCKPNAAGDFECTPETCGPAFYRRNCGRQQEADEAVSRSQPVVAAFAAAAAGAALGLPAACTSNACSRAQKCKRLECSATNGAATGDASPILRQQPGGASEASNPIGNAFQGEESRTPPWLAGPSMACCASGFRPEAAEAAALPPPAAVSAAAAPAASRKRQEAASEAAALHLQQRLPPASQAPRMPQSSFDILAQTKAALGLWKSLAETAHTPSTVLPPLPHRRPFASAASIASMDCSVAGSCQD